MPINDYETAVARIVTRNQPAFPSIAPHPEAVYGEEILGLVCGTIRQYASCSSDTAVAATLWTAMTWYLDSIEFAPIALIAAAGDHCDTSALFDVRARISRRPLPTSKVAPHAIFPLIEAHSPTLVIEATDSMSKHNHQFANMITSKPLKAEAFVYGAIRNRNNTKSSTWCAKLICGIGDFPQTILKHSIVLDVQRTSPKDITIPMRRNANDHFIQLTSKLARWSRDQAEAIRYANPATLPELSYSEQECWEPLFATADLAGGKWPQLARLAAQSISRRKAETEEPDASVGLLRDIHKAFTVSHRDRFSTRELIEILCIDNDRPWQSFNEGNPITPTQLAECLREFRIHPKSTRFEGQPMAKGYQLDQFRRAFAEHITQTH